MATYKPPPEDFKTTPEDEVDQLIRELKGHAVDTIEQAVSEIGTSARNLLIGGTVQAIKPYADAVDDLTQFAAGTFAQRLRDRLKVVNTPPRREEEDE